MQNLFIIRAVIFILFASLLEYFWFWSWPRTGAGVKDGDSSVKFFWLSDNCSYCKNFSEVLLSFFNFHLFLFLLFQKIISVLIIQLLLQIFVLRRFLRAAQASYKVMWLVQFIFYACFRRYQPLLIKKWHLHM
jgi:hypothetical protein